MTELDGCYRWVSTFNQMPTDMFREWAENYGEGNDKYFQELTIYDEGDGPADDYPVWGWMWGMPTEVEEDKLEEHLQEVCDIGFRVFDTEYGHYVGLDGGGYDFYEKHWLPLYRLFGMHWHDEEEAET